jgi:L-threonylcarbamoyladenylate synthase
LKQNSIFEKVSALDPEPRIIQAAAKVLMAGGLLAFPTTGLYGLGADALNPGAVDRIFQVKQRDRGKPILVLIRDVSELGRVAVKVPESALRMMAAFWPGSLTVILEARPGLPEVLTGGTGKIGIRVPGHPVAQALVRAVDGPVTGTSANLSGRGGCSSAAGLSNELTRHLDMVLDAGKLKGGPGSTVVDATSDPPRVLREGAVSPKNLSMVV